MNHTTSPSQPRSYDDLRRSTAESKPQSKASTAARMFALMVQRGAATLDEKAQYFSPRLGKWDMEQLEEDFKDAGLNTADAVAMEFSGEGSVAPVRVNRGSWTTEGSSGNHSTASKWTRGGTSRWNTRGQTAADAAARARHESEMKSHGNYRHANHQNRSGNQTHERRLDKDGKAYTREQFYAYYHGHKEWDAATQAVAPRAGTMNGARAAGRR